ICADRWMRNQYGAELRRLVTSGYSVDFLIEMHDAQPFEDEVDAYPAVTVIRRSRQGTTVVATASPDMERAQASRPSGALLRLAGDRSTTLPTGLSVAVV